MSLVTHDLGVSQLERSKNLPSGASFPVPSRWLWPSAAKKIEELDQETHTVQFRLKAGVENNRAALEKSAKDSLEVAIADLRDLGLTFSLAEAHRMRAKLDQRLPTAEEIDNLLGRIRDELNQHRFFQVSKEHLKYFEPADPLFGKTFADRFPSGAVFEVDEAAKCLSLDRSTACVFHLMRVVEIGVGAVRQSLGIPDPIKPAERNWGKILAAIRDELGRRDTASPPCWQNRGDPEFFRDVCASLDAVKNAWRNATMHVESKYTSEEAERIWNATRGLMMKIAFRLDEAG